LRWRTVPDEALIWRELDGELVLRNAMTGSTHLLQPPAAQVLKTLIAEKQGLTAAELAAHIGDDAETPDMQELLGEFKRLGLAGPVD
jgi:hypothetical protein